ncbi:MAG: hypothetical protein JWR85_4074 [Marmoricola sp.]|nr:hypothetical protein [Marmoricola sp.]
MTNTPGEQASFLLFGHTKVGKSTLANTAPTPRLLLDAEAASRFLPGRKVRWNPLTDAPPVDDGTWDTCEVIVLEYAQMVKAMDYLESGQHPFASVVIDSISEIQKKLKDQLTGSQGLIVKDMDMKKWGLLLAHMEAMIRQLRDLTEHPAHPVNIVITAMQEVKEGILIPKVEGGLRDSLPYFVDVVGYLDTQDVASNDPTVTPEPMRFLATREGVRAKGGTPYLAGERVQGRIPRYVYGEDLSVARMLDMVFHPENTAVPAAT